MRNIFTKCGFELYEKRIKLLEAKVRAIGREVGEEAGMSSDWHDNFGFEDARRRLDQESQRLSEMIDATKGATVIEVQEQDSVIAIGVTVTLTINGDKRDLTIGGFGETEPSLQLISYNAPIAAAIMGLPAGRREDLSINGRAFRVEVIKLSPPSNRYEPLIRTLINQVGVSELD